MCERRFNVVRSLMYVMDDVLVPGNNKEDSVPYVKVLIGLMFVLNKTVTPLVSLFD